MPDDLFSQPPEYTIDSSSLMEIFGVTSWASKKIIPGLWEKVEELITQGIIISHTEVLAEIKKDGTKGEELFNWAHAHEHVFQTHQFETEGKIIRSMSSKYKAFVNNTGKASDIFADPWLIAQAKIRGLKIISEENRSGSKDPARFKIPNVCDDTEFGIKCLKLYDLTQERGWKFGAI